MFKEKPKISSVEIAERCLNHYWNSEATIVHGGGWDKGSPAHKWALKWTKRNFKYLKSLSWRQIYKEYEKLLVQD